MSDISSASGEGFSGILGIRIGNSQNNILKWNTGINYNYNFTDIFYEERNVRNGYKIEKLHYAVDSFDVYIDFDIKISENSVFRRDMHMNIMKIIILRPEFFAYWNNIYLE